MDYKKTLFSISMTHTTLTWVVTYICLLLSSVSVFGQKPETYTIHDSRYGKEGHKTIKTETNDPGGTTSTEEVWKDDKGVTRESHFKETYNLSGKTKKETIRFWDCHGHLIYQKSEFYDIKGDQIGFKEERYRNGKQTSGYQWVIDEYGRKTSESFDEKTEEYKKIAFEPSDAQTSAPPPDNSVCPVVDYANQIGGGFLLIREDSQPERFNTLGFTTDYTRAFTEHFGLTGNFDTTFGSQGGVHFTKTTYVGGLSVFSNHSIAKGVGLFAHALAGGAHLKSEFGPASTTSNSFAMKIGGGLDVAVAPHLSFRPIQVDYAPTYFNKRTQHNVSFSFSLDYHWGHPLNKP